jgi:hypothetical protein
MGRSGEFSRRARDYFLSTEDDYIFAFKSVCWYLNINPHHILILVGLEEDRRFRPMVPTGPTETQILTSDRLDV